MVKNTFIYALSLIVLGLGAYVATSMASVTAMIPSFFGVVFLVIGAVAMKPALRKHAMHAAAALALLIIVALVGRLTKADDFLRPAVIAQALTLLLSVGYLGLCVKSFIDARRNRLQA